MATKRWFWQKSKKPKQKPFSIFELNHLETYWYTTEPMPCLVWGDKLNQEKQTVEHKVYA